MQEEETPKYFLVVSIEVYFDNEQLEKEFNANEYWYIDYFNIETDKGNRRCCERTKSSLLGYQYG